LGEENRDQTLPFEEKPRKKNRSPAGCIIMGKKKNGEYGGVEGTEREDRKCLARVSGRGYAGPRWQRRKRKVCVGKARPKK